MTVKLSQASFGYAKELVEKGRVVTDDRDSWSEHQPSADEENRFIENHGWSQFGLWHLAVDDEAKPETKAYYKFPYGDFSRVHRCALLAAESRAAQQKYDNVEKAAAHLHGMLEAAAHPAARR